MLLKIRHALLDISNTAKQSAIIINNEVIISTACILQSNIQSSVTTDNDAAAQIIRRLQQCELINAQEEGCIGEFLKSFSYQVTFDRRKLPQTSGSNGIGVSVNLWPTSKRQATPNGTILTRYSAKILYVFAAPEISRNLHKILYGGGASELNVVQSDILRSSFLVLSIRPTFGKGKERFERFLRHIGNYLRYLQPVHTLDDILVMCTPFGLENFYKTISIGKVSNVMGPSSSIFSMSNPLPLGCEGAAVFNNKLRLIGIIMCTSFQRQQENVNLTLAANFAYLLRDFMRQLGVPIANLDVYREPSNFAWERTLVVIESSGSQGTGTFIKVHNKRFILTCAHVVGQVNKTVNCRGVDGEFESDVLWCNPQYNQPYDLALLTAPDSISEKYCVRLAKQRAVLGQTVYNAGFPYFVNFNLKYDFNPSIFQGRIIKCDQGTIMSDGSVQAGQSGGPMFDQNGCILGVCVSNLKIDDIIYPNINTAVPIFEISNTLEQYAKTNDLIALNNLVANRDIQRVWSLELPPILSKL